MPDLVSGLLVRTTVTCKSRILGQFRESTG